MERKNKKFETVIAFAADASLLPLGIEIALVTESVVKAQHRAVSGKEPVDPDDGDGLRHISAMVGGRGV